jgi:hypothetical protein
MFMGNSLDISVIVCILIALLKHIVIDIRNRKTGADTADIQCLKLQICHRSGRVLSKGLIDAQANFPAWGHHAFDQVRRDEFFRHGKSHFIPSSSWKKPNQAQLNDKRNKQGLRWTEIRIRLTGILGDRLIAMVHNLRRTPVKLLPLYYSRLRLFRQNSKTRE